MRNPLVNHIVYLAGPIDHAKDGGRTWRKDISEFFRQLGIGVFDPTNKPLGQDEGENFTQYINELKTNNYQLARQKMKEVVTHDLAMLDLSNFIVVYLDMDIYTCGTFSEITYAALEKKPVCIVCKQGKSAIPNWLWGLCKHELFFSSFDELKTFILNGKFDSWRLIDYSKVFTQNRDTYE